MQASQRNKWGLGNIVTDWEYWRREQKQVIACVTNFNNIDRIKKFVSNKAFFFSLFFFFSPFFSFSKKRKKIRNHLQCFFKSLHQGKVGFFPKVILFLTGFVSGKSSDIFNVSNSLSLSLLLHINVFYPVASSVLLKGTLILTIQMYPHLELL